MHSHVPSKGADGAISTAKDSNPSGKPGVVACSYCFKHAVDIHLLEDWILGRHKLGIHCNYQFLDIQYLALIEACGRGTFLQNRTEIKAWRPGRVTDQC